MNLKVPCLSGLLVWQISDAFGHVLHLCPAVLWCVPGQVLDMPLLIETHVHKMVGVVVVVSCTPAVQVSNTRSGPAFSYSQHSRHNAHGRWFQWLCWC
jgi:hypothetical protein